MKINIQHLDYTIYVKDPRKCKERLYNAWCQQEGKHQCTLYIQEPELEKNAALLAHEIIHILQYICETRHIDFISEAEHMGYLMQYLMNTIRRWEYVPRNKK